MVVLCILVAGVKRIIVPPTEANIPRVNGIVQNLVNTLYIACGCVAIRVDIALAEERGQGRRVLYRHVHTPNPVGIVHVVEAGGQNLSLRQNNRSTLGDSFFGILKRIGVVLFVQVRISQKNTGDIHTHLNLASAFKLRICFEILNSGLQIFLNAQVYISHRSARTTYNRVRFGVLLRINRNCQIAISSVHQDECAYQTGVCPTTNSQQLCIITTEVVLLIGNSGCIISQSRVTYFIYRIDSAVAGTNEPIVVGPVITTTAIGLHQLIRGKPTVTTGFHSHIATENITVHINGTLTKKIMVATIRIEQRVDTLYGSFYYIIHFQILIFSNSATARILVQITICATCSKNSHNCNYQNIFKLFHNHFLSIAMV